ncbi:hypothetical protein JCM3765_002206 [Sporobolomyces pararoseus]
MLLSLTSLLAFFATFSSFATALPARLSSDSELPSSLLPRGAFIRPGTAYSGLAYQGVNWGNRTFQEEEKYPCILMSGGWIFGRFEFCPSPWYSSSSWGVQEGVACPNTTISGEGKSWVSLSDNFLSKNGSLRKSCGKKVSVTSNGKTVEAEIRRSCDGKTVCPGENAIAVSPFLAKELGIQNEVLNGKELEWTYLG